MHAKTHVSAGGIKDLEAAIDICEKALDWRPTMTTAVGRASLSLLRDHLRGRLSRATERERVDALTAELVNVRHHHPSERAHRKRPPRLLRG